MSDGYAVLLPFDSDDPEFARGFEAGRVWTLLQSGEFGDLVIRASNAEMIMRMAERHGLIAVAEDLNEEFMSVRFCAP